LKTTSQVETPVKDARSPQNAAHFGSPTPRSAARLRASLTAASPADLQGLSSLKRIKAMEDTMSQAQHDHAAFDRFPALVKDLRTEFGTEGIGHVIEKFIAAEQADFLWEGRFAERNLGAFEGFDIDEDGCQRVGVMGYFRGKYYVAHCIVDAERNVTALLKSRQFESFESAESAFLVSS
jgi:hypothetical protein